MVPVVITGHLLISYKIKPHLGLFLFQKNRHNILFSRIQIIRPPGWLNLPSVLFTWNVRRPFADLPPLLISEHAPESLGTFFYPRFPDAVKGLAQASLDGVRELW